MEPTVGVAKGVFFSHNLFFSHHPALWAPLLGQEGSSMPQETLLLPEEEYPEGGRWWEKAPIGGGRTY